MNIPVRRILDLLVIVTIASGLLGLAWSVARERGQQETSLAHRFVADPEIPEMRLLLPLEKFGMVLTRESVEGNSERALEVLNQHCEEVLACADEWVLSLAVSLEEQQLLDSLVATEPLKWGREGFDIRSPKEQPFTERKTTLAQLYSLTQPTGRAGIRGTTPKGGTGSGAAAGRRLICWGFILSNGAEGHTVWFAKPREKLPRSESREGHTP